MSNPFGTPTTQPGAQQTSGFLPPGGPFGGTQPGPSPFGRIQTQPPPSPFGGTRTQPAAGPFGAPSIPTGAFGGPVTGTQSQPGPLGRIQTQPTTGSFTAPAIPAGMIGTPATQPGRSPFGGPTGTQPPPSPFGRTQTQPAAGPFGAPSVPTGAIGVPGAPQVDPQVSLIFAPPPESPQPTPPVSRGPSPPPLTVQVAPPPPSPQPTPPPSPPPQPTPRPRTGLTPESIFGEGAGIFATPPVSRVGTPPPTPQVGEGFLGQIQPSPQPPPQPQPQPPQPGIFRPIQPQPPQPQPQPQREILQPSPIPPQPTLMEHLPRPCRVAQSVSQNPDARNLPILPSPSNLLSNGSVSMDGVIYPLVDRQGNQVNVANQPAWTISSINDEYNPIHAILRGVLPAYSVQNQRPTDYFTKNRWVQTMIAQGNKLHNFLRSQQGGNALERLGQMIHREGERAKSILRQDPSQKNLTSQLLLYSLLTGVNIVILETNGSGLTPNWRDYLVFAPGQRPTIFLVSRYMHYEPLVIREGNVYRILFTPDHPVAQAFRPSN